MRLYLPVCRIICIYAMHINDISITCKAWASPTQRQQSCKAMRPQSFTRLPWPQGCLGARTSSRIASSATTFAINVGLSPPT